MAETNPTRRLAAILAADVVGYSRLMGADESGALAAVQSCIEEVVKPQLAAHNGRLVKLMGDGALAEFGSVVDAVKCAVAIQADMAARETLDASRIQLRIGVNLGDIIFDGDDIFGDGVNLAARLEGIAEPGGVCVSRTVADQVGTKAGVAFHPMGAQTLKNIAAPVEVFRVAPKGAPAPKPHRNRTPARYALLVLAGLGVAIAWWMTRPDFTPADPAKMAAPLPKGPSIAVLPFDYLGPDPDANGFLADGLSENIIAALARLPDAVVIARNSTFTYKGKAVDVREVSEKFGVRYVLEGSVQLSGEIIRVTAQLLDGVDGKHLWTETYDRPVADIFAVQDEITVAVAYGIYQKTISGSALRSAGGTKKLKAWSEHIEGVALLNTALPDEIKRSESRFERAIELDPGYAGAYASLAHVYFFKARWFMTDNPAAALSTAAELAEKALSLDPTNPTAYSALGMTRLIQRRGEEAVAAVLAGVEAAPGDAFAQASAAWVLTYAGDAKRALPYFERAKRMFVIVPWWVFGSNMKALSDVGDFEAQIALEDKFGAHAPSAFKAHWLAGGAVSRFRAGREDEARRLMAEARALDPDLSIQAVRVWDTTYIDPAIPERRYEVLRQLGLPETPPSGG